MPLPMEPRPITVTSDDSVIPGPFEVRSEFQVGQFLGSQFFSGRDSASNARIALGCHELAKAVGDYFLALVDVGRKATDVRHEHPWLPGNVRAQIPGAAGRKKSVAGELVDVLNPGILQLLF